MKRWCLRSSAAANWSSLRGLPRKVFLYTSISTSRSSALGRRSSAVRSKKMSSSYRDLRVWQQAMDLTVQVYEFTEKFPKHEMYGLSSQLRRAAVSVPSNIAEGKGRNT